MVKANDSINRHAVAFLTKLVEIDQRYRDSKALFEVMDRFDDEAGQFDKALQSLREIHDTDRLADILLSAYSYIGSRVFSLRQTPQQRIELMEIALQTARRNECVSLLTLGNIYAEQGLYEEAQNCHQQALAIAQSIDNKLEIIASLSNIGLVYNYQQHYQDAVHHFQRALQLAQQNAYQYEESVLLNHLGYSYMESRHYSQAETCFQQSLELATAIEDIRIQAQVQGNLCNLYLAQDNSHEALPHGQNCLHTYELLKEDEGKMKALLTLGRIWWLLKQYTKALEDLQTAESIAHERDDKRTAAVSLFYQGCVYADQGRRQEALAAGQQALQEFNTLGLYQEAQQVQDFIQHL